MTTTEATSLLDTIGFKPTGPEQAAIIACKKPRVLTSGGARAGKSHTSEKKLIDRLPDDIVKHIEWMEEAKRSDPLLYWLIAADYERTKAEFDFLVDDFTKIFGESAVNASKPINPGSITVTIPATTESPALVILVETKSASDPRRIAMKAPYGIILCEASQVDFDTYQRCLERLAEKDGWLIMAGTFEWEAGGQTTGWYLQLFQAWRGGTEYAQSFVLPSPTNIHVFKGGYDDPKILELKESTSDEYFMQRIMGEPVPPRGIVFRFSPAIHVRTVEYIPGQDVWIAIDPGYAGAHALLAAHIIHDQIQVFDEIYENKIDEDVIRLLKERSWYRDLVERTDATLAGVIDQSGWGHQGARAPSAEIWLQEIGVHLKAQTIKSVNDLDARLKWFLEPNPTSGEPKVIFSPRCKGILSEMGTCPSPLNGLSLVYSWAMDRDGNITGTTPDNKNNHSIRALEYLIIDRFGYGMSTEMMEIPIMRF
jgi:hypothetical protein